MTRVLLLLALLAGCSDPRPLTAQEIAEAQAFCRAHHRDAVSYAIREDKQERVVAVQCVLEDTP